MKEALGNEMETCVKGQRSTVVPEHGTLRTSYCQFKPLMQCASGPGIRVDQATVPFPSATIICRLEELEEQEKNSSECMLLYLFSVNLRHFI